jgi:hypothetical protein
MNRLAFLFVLLLTAACQPAASVNPSDYQRKTAAVTAGLPPVYVSALCTLMGLPVRSEVPVGHPLIIIWGWSAATEDQIEEYIQASIVMVTFDGIEIQGQQQGGIPYDKSAKNYKVVWASNLGVAKLGIHMITYSLTFKKEIFDGLAYYGPGTKNEKQEDACEIEVK